MAGRTDLEQLQFQISSDVNALAKSNAKILAMIKDDGGKWKKEYDRIGSGLFEKFMAPPHVSEAMNSIFSRARLGVIEEGSARIGIFGGAIEHLGGVGIAAAAGVAALAAAVEQAKSAAEWAEGIEKSAAKLGVTTDQLQELQFVALKSGIPFDAFAEALMKGNAALGAFQSNIGDAKIKAAFKALGFTKDQLRDYNSVADILPMIADRISKLGSIAEQEQIAKKLGLEAILPAMLKGGDAMKALADEAHKLGIVLDESLIRKGAQSAEALKVAGNVLDKNVKSIFIDLAPAVANVSTALAEASRAIAQFGKDAGFAFLAVKDLAGKLADIELALHGLQGLQLPKIDTKSGIGKFAKDEALSPILLGPVDRWIFDKLAERGREMAADAAPPLRGGHGGHLWKAPVAALAPETAKHGPTAQQQAEAAQQEEKHTQDDILDAMKRRLAAENNSFRSLEDQQGLQDLEIQTARQKRDADLDEQAKQFALSKGMKGLSDAQVKRIKAANQLADAAEDDLRRNEQHKALDDQQLQIEGEQINAQKAVLDLWAGLAGTTQERQAAEMASLALSQQMARDQLEARIKWDAQYAGPAGNDQADRDRALLDQKQGLETLSALLQAATRRQADADKISDAQADAQIEILQSQDALAKTALERRAVELRILALQKEEEARRLRAVADVNSTATEGEKNAANIRLGQLDEIYKGKAAEIDENTIKGPFRDAIRGALDAAVKGGWPGLAQYMADQLREKMLDRLADVFTNIVFGSGKSGDGGGIAGTVLNALGSVFTGPHAAGGYIPPGKWGTVGERGMEAVFGGRAGVSVVPQGQFGAIAPIRPMQVSQHTITVVQPISYDLRGAVMTQDLLVQMNALAKRSEIRAVAQSASLTRKNLAAWGVQDHKLKG